MAVSPDDRTLQSAHQTACTYFEQSGLKTAHNLELPRKRRSVRLGAPPTCPAMNTKTAFDLIFRNARTRSSAIPVDIGVAGGPIAAIEPPVACGAAGVPVGGRLPPPRVVENPNHPHKASPLRRLGDH